MRYSDQIAADQCGRYKEIILYETEFRFHANGGLDNTHTELLSSKVSITSLMQPATKILLPKLMRM